MAIQQVLFIQGGGDGAHAADSPLADALQQALGAAYDVRYPPMPDEGEPDMARWKRQIAAELPHLLEPVVLVGHSLGGSALLRLLSEEHVTAAVAGLYLLATPAFDGKDWPYDDLKLHEDAADRLAAIPRLVLYHCRDDETVPFAHLALHARQLPLATTRALPHGGHQFGNDLGVVAADIRAGEVG